MIKQALQLLLLLCCKFLSEKAPKYIVAVDVGNNEHTQYVEGLSIALSTRLSTRRDIAWHIVIDDC